MFFCLFGKIRSDLAVELKAKLGVSDWVGWGIDYTAIHPTLIHFDIDCTRHLFHVFMLVFEALSPCFSALITFPRSSVLRAGMNTSRLPFIGTRCDWAVEPRSSRHIARLGLTPSLAKLQHLFHGAALAPRNRKRNWISRSVAAKWHSSAVRT
jgi:hypothetical protein